MARLPRPALAAARGVLGGIAGASAAAAALAGEHAPAAEERRGCCDAAVWALGEKLEAAAREQAPLRRVLARIAGRLVAARGWERLGFARVGDWARERAGVSGRQVYDLAHTDAALARLPHADAALSAGQLSWSKARLLCRVATAEDEARWVDLARRLPVRTLEREVRAVDRGAVESGGLLARNETERSWPQRTVEIRCAPHVLGKWYGVRQLAQRVAGEKLPRWACMEAVAAEMLSAVPATVAPLASFAWEDDVREGLAEARAANQPPASRLEGGSAANVCKTQGPGNEPDRTHPPAEDDAPPAVPPLPPALRPLVERLDEADAFALDDRFRRAMALEQRLWSRVGSLLARAAASSMHRAFGHPSLETYAREKLGLSPRKVRALLRLERTATVFPALGGAYRDGQLSWVQAQTLVPLALLDAAAPFLRGWLVHARAVSARRLEDDVDFAVTFAQPAPPDPGSRRQTCALDSLAENDPFAPAATSAGAPAAASATPALRRETHRFFFTAPRDVALVIEAALCTARRHIERRTGRLPTRGEAIDAMFDHALATWGRPERFVPSAHRIYQRDGWRCTAPGCTAYRNLQDHHVRFRSAGGSDDPSNRTTLCAWHHLRGVHAGTIRCAGEAPDTLVFDLGVRDPRPALVRYRSGDVLVRSR